jgi:alpha-mannosidase
MADTEPTLYFIPHTHWEGAVFQTRDAYLDMGLANITRALALLRARPDARFVLDQVCYVKPYLERHPHEAADFRRFVDQGRLAIVGGTDVMLDVNMPGGESFVRQALYGKRWFREALGVDVKVGWQLDTFGHHAQMPQLLRQAGFDSFWFFRGVPNWQTPSEFVWEGLDGTRIPAFWLQHSYAVAYGSPQTLPEFAAFMRERYDSLGGNTPHAARVAPSGADVCEPEEHVPGLAAQMNADPDAGLKVVVSVPADYEAAVARRGELPTLKCELNPVFQGIYSSRIELKQRTRELEEMLTGAEKLGVMLQAAGRLTDDRQLWQGWEPMLFNQAHDIMSGVLTDRVYDDTIGGYDHSRRIAVAEGDDRLRAYAGAVDTRGSGIPIVVTNLLGFARTDVARATVGLTAPGVRGLRLTGPDGRETPVQIEHSAGRPDGTLVEAGIAFLAAEVPALGHAVYRLEALQEAVPGARPEPVTTPSGCIETDLLCVEVDATGAITSLLSKADGVQSLSAPGNVVARQEDRGDFWEPYKPLDGGSRIAMTDRHPAPAAGEAEFSTDEAADGVTVLRGPVYSEIAVAHGFGKGNFATTVRVYEGLPRVEVRTSLLNNDHSVRYRALFPTGMTEGANLHEIPFGAIERPEGIEFPAQNWFSTCQGGRGLAILNRGLPGANTADGVMMVSLFRSTCIVAYGYGGGYGPGMSSDSGYMMGKELTFEYALVPHGGDAFAAQIPQQGQALNSPLRTAPAAAGAGALPPVWGLLAVDAPNVLVSTVRTSENGGAVVRFYEAAGQAAPDVRVRFAAPVASVEEVNLLEEEARPLALDGDTVTVGLSPFQIRTLRFRLA